MQLIFCKICCAVPWAPTWGCKKAQPSELVWIKCTVLNPLNYGQFVKRVARARVPSRLGWCRSSSGDALVWGSSPDQRRPLALPKHLLSNANIHEETKQFQITTVVAFSPKANLHCYLMPLAEPLSSAAPDRTVTSDQILLLQCQKPQEVCTYLLPLQSSQWLVPRFSHLGVIWSLPWSHNAIARGCGGTWIKGPFLQDRLT